MAGPGTRVRQRSTIAIPGTPLQIIDLSGATPVVTDYTPPISGVYAAASASQWVLASDDGALLDGTSLATTPRDFGYGSVRSLAGSQTRLAVATSIGRVLIFNTSNFSLETTLDYAASELSISADGSVLALRASGSPNVTGANDDSVSTISLPTGTVINTWPYTQNVGTYATDITLSSSGTLLGQVLGGANGAMRQVTASTGGVVLWSDTGSSQPIRLSLDDTLIATSSAPTDAANVTTTVYLNDVQSTAVPGWSVGWLEGDLLLQDQGQSAVVFNCGGIKQSGPTLPLLSGPLQPLTSTAFYDSSTNAIYSTATGTKTWSSPVYASPGTVAGLRIVYVADNQLIAELY
jgi:hypothetical protein